MADNSVYFYLTVIPFDLLCYDVWHYLVAEEPADLMVNPFKLPSDNEIFLLRDKEKQRKMQVNKCCRVMQWQIDS